MRDALSRHASHAATTRCETLVVDRIAASSTCRRCGARPLRAHLATTFATPLRQPSHGRNDDTRENPHACRKAACDKALRHALKIVPTWRGRVARRAPRRHRSASRHRSTRSPRDERRAHRRRRQPSRHGGTHGVSTSPRASPRSVREHRSSDAPTQRFALRERDVDAPPTLDRRSIDARSMTVEGDRPRARPHRRRPSTILDADRRHPRRPFDGPRSPSPSIARHRSPAPDCRTMADTIACPCACADACPDPCADGMRTCADFVTACAGPASNIGRRARCASRGRALSISEEETMHRRTTCKRA